MAHHNAPTTFSWTRVFISGAGFLADSYDLFIINICVDLMALVDYHERPTQSVQATVKTTALLGAIVGQLGFGALADIIGRKKVFIVTCVLVILGAIMSATVQDTESSTCGIYCQLAFWRFILGVGVGGEYPLSAAVTAEGCHPSQQCKQLAMVFSMQGLGTVLCSLVLISVTGLMGDRYDAQWRVALSMGALPMVCAFYFRWKLHEQAWNNPTIQQNIQTSSNTGVQRLLLTLRLAVRQLVDGWVHVRQIVYTNRWSLLGTAGAWFLLDVVFYANGLFSGQVTKVMGIAQNPRGEALASFILQAIALPGYICTVAFIERVGLRRLQLMGFLATSIIFFILAGCQSSLSELPALYITLYGITFFFQNFGPNATTYIMPSVIYIAEHRATCHGISSAAGKLGAVVGAQFLLSLAYAFCENGVCTDDSPPEQIDAGLQATFAVCGAIGIIGTLWTLWLTSESAMPPVVMANNVSTIAMVSSTESKRTRVGIYQSVMRSIPSIRKSMPSEINSIVSEVQFTPLQCNEASEHLENRDDESITALGSGQFMTNDAKTASI